MNVLGCRVEARANAKNVGESFGAGELVAQICAHFAGNCRTKISNATGGRDARIVGGRIIWCSGKLLQNGFEQVGGGVGFGDHLFGQVNREGVIEPQHQLDALEAAESQIALEMRRLAFARKFVKRAGISQFVQERCYDFANGWFEMRAFEFGGGGAHNKSRAVTRKSQQVRRCPEATTPVQALQLRSMRLGKRESDAGRL